MMAETEVLRPAARGVALVATGARFAGAMMAIAVLLLAASQAYGSLLHRAPWVPSAPVIAISFGIIAALCWSTLQAEEVCLARELRTARSGTPALRAMFAARRAPASVFARILSTRLGTAAVLLADGSRSEALDAIARGSLLMRGGRLERLRQVVEADLQRAVGTPAGLERCVQELRAVHPIGNREADLYRTHVRAKALLELGDVDRARELVDELSSSRDEDERVYLVWLRAWFDLDAEDAGVEKGRAWAPISEGDLRMATLLARAHGADMLVEKLDARLAAIAEQVQGE